MSESTPFKESVPFHLANTAIGPVQSIFLRAGNIVTHGRAFAEYNQQPPPPSQEILTIHQTPQVLTHVFKRLEESEIGGLKSLYDNWNEVREKLQQVIGNDHVITDYVSFEPHQQRFILFLKTKNPNGSARAPYILSSVIVPSTSFSIESLQNLIVGQCTWVELQSESDWATTESGTLPKTADLIEMEQSIRKIHGILEANETQTVTHRLSRSANTHVLRRNKDFDRDGTIITNIRELPVYTLGELQELQRFLFAHGITFNPQAGDIEINSELAEQWIKMRKLVGIEKKQAEHEMTKYGRETTYFTFVTKFFTNCPDEVYAFMNSVAFRQHEDQFKNVYFAARAQTEFAVARAMLANFFLMHFEGTDDMKESASQYGLAGNPDYQTAIGKYINSRRSNMPRLPQVTTPEHDQQTELSQIYTDLDPKPSMPEIDAEKLQIVALKADAALNKIPYEIRRQHIGSRVWDRVKVRAHLNENPDRKARIFSKAIANLGMARVPGEGRFTASSWQNGGEFLTEGIKPMPFEKQDETKSIEDSLRHIFNGEVMKTDERSTPSAYQSQVSRIQIEGAAILNFLQTDPKIPDNVKKFMATLTTDEAAFRILERFGPICDQDPNVVNRFYANFEDFRTAMLHRYVTDFVRGVETKLIDLTQPAGDKFARKTFGGWKNYDFSKVKDDTLRLAMTYALAHAEHRIKRLNHETREIITLKDIQETLEKWIGTDTYDMKYLRYDELMDIWNSLGGAWDCICFSRKTLFNPETLQQF